MSAESPHEGGTRGPAQGRPDSSTDCWIPNHDLHPAEADLRLGVNVLPCGKPSFWLGYLRWNHRYFSDCGCNGCRLGDAA